MNDHSKHISMRWCVIGSWMLITFGCFIRPDLNLQDELTSLAISGIDTWASLLSSGISWACWNHHPNSCGRAPYHCNTALYWTDTHTGSIFLKAKALSGRQLLQTFFQNLLNHFRWQVFGCCFAVLFSQHLNQTDKTDLDSITQPPLLPVLISFRQFHKSLHRQCPWSRAYIRQQSSSGQSGVRGPLLVCLCSDWSRHHARSQCQLPVPN